MNVLTILENSIWIKKIQSESKKFLYVDNSDVKLSFVENGIATLLATLSSSLWEIEVKFVFLGLSFLSKNYQKAFNKIIETLRKFSENWQKFSKNPKQSCHPPFFVILNLKASFLQWRCYNARLQSSRSGGRDLQSALKLFSYSHGCFLSFSRCPHDNKKYEMEFLKLFE